MKLLAGERIKLQDENKFVQVIEGNLEVYAVTRKKKSFRQIFLTELSKGDAAFHAMDDFGYIDFLIYAVENSEIEVVEKNSVPLEKLISLIENWFSKLVELSWLRLMADRGDDVLRSWQDRKIFSDTENSFAEIDLIFAEHEKTLSSLIGVNFRAEDKKNSRRVEVRQGQKQRLLEETVSDLLGEETFIYDDGEKKNLKFDEAAFIVRRIAQALEMSTENIKLVPEVIGKLDRFGLIRRLFQKGNIAIRLVKLVDDWYKKDCGILLG